MPSNLIRNESITDKETRIISLARKKIVRVVFVRFIYFKIFIMVDVIIRRSLRKVLSFMYLIWRSIFFG